MTDFAQVYAVRVSGIDANGGSVNITFNYSMQHAGGITTNDTNGTSFLASGGIAAMEAAIGNQVRALFLAQFGTTLAANLVVIESHKLI